MTAARRLASLAQHVLAPSPTEGQPLAAELKTILEALGPEPLKATSRRMFYQNLRSIDKSFPEGPLPPLSDRGGKNLPDLVSRIQKLAPPPEDGPSDGFLQIAKALLLHAADALDEAHSVAVQVSINKHYKGSGARRDATYAHALVHRSEGENKGAEDVQRVPGGSMGFDSTRLIMNSIDASKGGKHVLYPKVAEAAQKLAEGTKNEAILGHMRFHDGGWSWSEFAHFCKDSYLSKDPEAIAFCEKVMNAEWRILLDHVLAQAKIEAPATA